MIIVESDDYHRGRIDLLDHLMLIADRTSGQAVWKALFNEARINTDAARQQHAEWRKIREQQEKASGGLPN